MAERLPCRTAARYAAGTGISAATAGEGDGAAAGLVVHAVASSNAAAGAKRLWLMRNGCAGYKDFVGGADCGPPQWVV